VRGCRYPIGRSVLTTFRIKNRVAVVHPQIVESSASVDGNRVFGARRERINGAVLKRPV
jgi:hypothetical protein